MKRGADMESIMDVAGAEAPLKRGDSGPLLLKGGTLGQAMERLHAVLKPGDLIFVDRRGWLYRQVAKATDSWTSQVGLVLRDAQGKWVVYEAAVPFVRRVPLERFIRRTRGNRFAVRRLMPPPEPGEIERLTEAAEERVGRFNALGFDYDSKQLFCTKLVHEVYAQALGRQLGQVTTLGDLRRQMSPGTLRFWRFWYLGRVPWQRRTITPHSLFTDPALETVFESF